jgi:hypothetical protein
MWLTFNLGTLVIVIPHLILLSAPASPEEPSSSDSQLYRIPIDIDISIHLVPAVSLLLDFFLVERKYTAYQLKYRAPLLAIATSLVFDLWMEYCASKNGACEYIELNVLSSFG